MKMVVIIPALNEERTVGAVVAGVPADIPGISEVVRVVVDDGSTDSTAEVARKAGAVVLVHTRRRGVGAAFQTGKGYAIGIGADVMVNIDADGQFDAQDIAEVIRPIMENRADVVTASRFANPDFAPAMPWIKLWGNRAMARLVNRLAGTSLADVSCGLRAYSKEALIRLNLVGNFTYTQETLLVLALSGLRVVEVPVRVKGKREFGKSRVARNLFLYAAQTSVIIFRTYRDYRSLRFFWGAGLVCAVAGVIPAVFLVSHYLRTGRISPHKWAAFVAGFFLIVALLMFLFGIMADMNTRLRAAVEEVLANQRRMIMERRRKDRQ